MGSVLLEAVTKRFGAVTALDAVDLAVRQGELIALLGPSGCGKTTLLRSVAGLERPDSGIVRIGERDVTDVPTRERPIGMVFQSYALFPNLTVRANIAFPLEVRGMPATAVRSRVDEMLTLCHLEPQADRYPNQISGGQAQRCALGRALAPAPEVLLLDEPLSALDALVRIRLRDEIRRVQQQVSITTLYVTHDQSEAMAIADRVAVMNHGRIEQLDPPPVLYEQPTSTFSAGFVGSRNAVPVAIRSGSASLGDAFTIDADRVAGSRAIAYFRPEDVQIGRQGEPGLPASVELAVFLGATTRLHIGADLDGTPVRFHADLPSREASTLPPGAPITVRVDPRHVRLFAAASEPTEAAGDGE